MSKRRKMLVVVVENLIELIESREYLLASRQSEKYFTRRRKMSFTNYIWYLLTTAKRSLTSGLQAFVKELNVSWDSYSKQAFSQGRQRIKPEAIKALMCATQERFYREANYATWRGMRVSAIDGSRYNLPTSEELREHYGVQKSSGEQVQALGSCLYDVLNGLILDAQLTRVDGNERELAKQHFDVLKANPARRGEKELLLMDRGYPSYELIREMTQRGFLYAMRCCREFCKSMQLDGRNDCVIEHRFARAKENTRLRVIRFALDNGDEEIIVTNLFDTSLTVQDFKALYHLRWSIETSYNNLKNKLEIEDFSGRSVLAVEQDYYATVTVANLVSILMFDNREQIDAFNASADRKFVYKQNVNTTVGLLKDELLLLLMDDSPRRRKRRMLRLMSHALRSLVPLRPDRSFPRKRSHPSNSFPQNARRP